jgi:hypothetical protein
MHKPDPVDLLIQPPAPDISLEKYVTKILSDYGVTNSRLNDDQNQKIEVSAANTREQLHLHIVASASEAIILRDLFEARLGNVSEKLDAYIAYHREVHSVLKTEIRRAHDSIKALALAIQAHLGQHEKRNLGASKSKSNLNKLGT